jgi:hypothetical protein
MPTAMPLILNYTIPMPKKRKYTQASHSNINDEITYSVGSFCQQQILMLILIHWLVKTNIPKLPTFFVYLLFFE